MYSPRREIRQLMGSRANLVGAALIVVLSTATVVQTFRVRALNRAAREQQELIRQKDTLLQQKDAFVTTVQRQLDLNQAQIEQLSAELREPKIAAKRVLLAKLEAAKRDAVQRERRAFSEGQLKILESVRVRGVPSMRERWFGLVTDHYYTWRVEISGQVFFESMQQETEQGYDAIDSLSSGIQLATFLIRPKV